MPRVDELAHASGLGGEGADRPEIRAELCPDGAGKRFRGAVRSQVYFPAGGEHLPGFFIQNAAFQDVRRADGLPVRIKPQRIRIAAAAETEGQIKPDGVLRTVRAEKDLFRCGQGAGGGPEGLKKDYYFNCLT